MMRSMVPETVAGAGNARCGLALGGPVLDQAQRSGLMQNSLLEPKNNLIWIIYMQVRVNNMGLEAENTFHVGPFQVFPNQFIYDWVWAGGTTNLTKYIKISTT